MIFLLQASYLYASDMGDFEKKYLYEIESRDSAIFFTCCGSKVNPKYSATLLFEVGSKTGLLVEKNDKVVINLATVKIGAKGIIIEETHGGVYSYERVKKLIDELIRHKFQFLIPMRVKEFENVNPVEMCVNTP
jgi:hypothetical protein